MLTLRCFLKGHRWVKYTFPNSLSHLSKCERCGKYDVAREYPDAKAW